MTSTYKRVSVRIFGRDGTYTDHAADALCTEEIKSRGNDGFGDDGQAVYVLSGKRVMPGTGDVITDGDRAREITAIRICRDLGGEIRAVRCTTLN